MGFWEDKYSISNPFSIFCSFFLSSFFGGGGGGGGLVMRIKAKLLTFRPCIALKHANPSVLPERRDIDSYL